MKSVVKVLPVTLKHSKVSKLELFFRVKVDGNTIESLDLYYLLDSSKEPKRLNKKIRKELFNPELFETDERGMAEKSRVYLLNINPIKNPVKLECFGNTVWSHVIPDDGHRYVNIDHVFVDIPDDQENLADITMKMVGSNSETQVYYNARPPVTWVESCKKFF